MSDDSNDNVKPIVKENELKVFYAGGLDEVLDDAIEECLKPFGYSRWASGQEIETEIRDLAFEIKKVPD